MFLQNQKESKENSICMLKELNSVLAVRNVEKQRKRELRERKKQGGLLSSTDALVSHSQPSADQEMPKFNIQEKPVAMGSSQGSSILEEATTETQTVEDGLESKACLVPIDSKLSPEKSVEGFDNESHKFDLPLNLSSREEQLGDSALHSSAIAQAVAAIALRAGRANKEELFHDEQDWSSTTSEAETDQP